jgi:hypothetical protein
MNFWLPYLESCSSKIQAKLSSIGCDFEDVHEINGFSIFGFIDNTMNSTCHPGGGPTRDGINAPRNDPLIQRAFYNGWKKLHGLKWQTIDLPYGMNYHVYGPSSLRRNDLWQYHESNINQKLATTQIWRQNQYKIYGDSAYIVLNDTHIRARHHHDNLSPREILENRKMSSCREVIEWDYGNVRTMWAFVDYKKILKLRCKMDVGKLYLLTMILRNAHNSMNESNTSLYFNCIPPTFEIWISQSPKKRID